MDAALGDHDSIPRRPRHELELCAAVDLERCEVARVDPDRVGAERDRPLELLGVVRLDERVEPERRGGAHELCGARVVEVAEQDERRVGSRLSETPQVVLLAEEALAEERCVGGRAGRAEVVERAAEALVDEDGERCRAGRREARGERGGIGVGPQVADRGRAPLDLRDPGEAGAGERVAKPRH